MSLDREILRCWREFCEDIAGESRTIREFFRHLQIREEFARLSRSHNWRIERNPDLGDDDPWQHEARHRLFRLYLGRTSHYVLTCVSQPREDDGTPDITEVLTDLAAAALSQEHPHQRMDGGTPYFIPIPQSRQRVADDPDWLFWKPLRLPLLIGRRFQDHLGRARWEILARRLKRLHLPFPTSLVHSPEWWAAQHRRLNNTRL